MDKPEQVKNLRRIPMGEKDNLFEYLRTLTASEIKMYCVLQQQSKWNSELHEEHRYIDYTNSSLDEFYKMAMMSKKTGIKVLSSLEKKRFIKKCEYVDNMQVKRKHIRIPNDVGTIFTYCNLDLDLYRILRNVCSPITVKVYLYHCYMGSKHKDVNYTYKQSLTNIAQAVGYSKTNLSKLIASHKLLIELDVITIDKKWENVNSDFLRCENVYTFNPNRRCKTYNIKKH